MDDRELSSPVCYLDYDHEVPAVVYAKTPFCTTCAAFILTLNSKDTDGNTTNIEDLSNGKHLTFLLKGADWMYKTTENIARTAADGCPLCLVIFQGLEEDQRDLLINWKEDSEQVETEECFEFQGEIRQGGIGFQMIACPMKSTVALDMGLGISKGKGLRTGALQNIKDIGIN